MSISLREIIDTCKAEAISSRMNISEQSEWKYFCRYFSKKFNTDLLLVEKLPPEYVIAHVLEDQLEDTNVLEKIDELMDMVYVLEDPEYNAKEEENLNEFIKLVEKQESARLKSGEPIIKKTEKDEASIPGPGPGMPTQGSVNLSYLEKLDEES